MFGQLTVPSAVSPSLCDLRSSWATIPVSFPKVKVMIWQAELWRNAQVTRVELVPLWNGLQIDPSPLPPCVDTHLWSGKQLLTRHQRCQCLQLSLCDLRIGKSVPFIHKLPTMQCSVTAVKRCHLEKWVMELSQRHFPNLGTGLILVGLARRVPWSSNSQMHVNEGTFLQAGEPWGRGSPTPTPAPSPSLPHLKSKWILMDSEEEPNGKVQQWSLSSAQLLTSPPSGCRISSFCYRFPPWYAALSQAEVTEPINYRRKPLKPQAKYNISSSKIENLQYFVTVIGNRLALKPRHFCYLLEHHLLCVTKLR